MIIKHETLGDSMFWANYLCSSFGQIGEPFDPEKTLEVFALDEKSAIKWWHDFTGYYEGIFDDSDGEVDDPSTLLLQFRSGMNLSIEFHAGDTYYKLNAPDNSSELLGNVGPHWILPILRWQEAITLSEISELKLSVPQQQQASLALLALLPCVWLTEGDDVEYARGRVKEAWVKSGLLDSRKADILIDNWLNAVDARKEYRWWQHTETGWVTNAHWSMRYAGRPAENVSLINRLLIRAGTA